LLKKQKNVLLNMMLHLKVGCILVGVCVGVFYTLRLVFGVGVGYTYTRVLGVDFSGY
jgi:hypothetical protein